MIYPVELAGRVFLSARFVLLIFLAGGLAEFGSGEASAQSGGMAGMTWQFGRFADPSNGGAATSLITVGVPETDFVIAQAACQAGASGGQPVLVLSADTFGLGEGAPLDVTLFADAGPISLRGDVKSAQSEEDYTGVRLRLTPADPLWQVLQRMGAITYSVGQNSYQLPLAGSSRAISALLADCTMMAGGGQVQVPVPAAGGGAEGATGGSTGGFTGGSTGNQAFDPRWASCDAFAGNVSINSNIPVTVTFANRTDSYRAILWIGFDGIPVDYAGLASGEEFTIATYVTHPWMITDGPGNCLEMFMPQPGINRFEITAPNRFFGPE